MSALKKLREANHISQKELAKEIEVYSKDLEKWEKSPKTITKDGLSSIAYYFGLSSEELQDAISGEISELTTSHYHIHSYKNFLDGWWGYFCVNINGEIEPKCFPITTASADRVSNNLASSEFKNRWQVIDTLNNRTLVFNPSNVNNILLLDEAGSPPSPEWDVAWTCSRMPDEFFKALEAHYLLTDVGELDESEEVSNYSKKDIETFTDIHDLDIQLVSELMTTTHIYSTNGTSQSQTIAKEKLANLQLSVDGNEPPILLDFGSTEDGYDLYIPSNNIALIDMPKRYANKSLQDDG